MKDLLERKLLYPQQVGQNQWTFKVQPNNQPAAPIHVPSTIQAVIRSRLNRLSPNAYALLMAAAILEECFTFGHLCVIADLAPELGISALDELLAGRLLIELDQPNNPSTFTFLNKILRDVVYTEAGDTRRRLFHRRALELLETIKTFPAVLAHHAAAAGLAEAAFRHSLTAGQEALRVAAMNEAKIHLEQARQLALESASVSSDIQPHICDLYLNLARAYEMSGQMAQAQAVYDELQRLLAK